MSTSTELAERPSCVTHGYMNLRTEVHTPEQRFCGTWYDCADAHCRTVVLLPSPELLAQ